MAPNEGNRPVETLLDKEKLMNSSEFSENFDHLNSDTISPKEYKPQIIWYQIAVLIFLHVNALYGVYLIFAGAKLMTTVFAIILYHIALWGITAGAHRLWTHRSYKAKTPLKIILLMFNSISYQGSAYHWARDHRVHHRYSETDADPHNSKRGFFFSHVGWLLTRKHPEVIAKGKTIDVTDLRNDKLLMLQKKYFLPLTTLFCWILPTVIPMYFWNESFINAFCISTNLRLVLVWHAIFLINSVAHMWGERPYDKTIKPAQSLFVAIAALGEGWHNFHHVFPWVYNHSEIGPYYVDFTTAFIDFFAKIGWAYDLKTIDPQTVKERAQRKGDGSYPRLNEKKSEEVPYEIDTVKSD